MPIDKKYVKLSLAAVAVVALVVGLAVGLAPKRRADPATFSAANAKMGGTLGTSDYYYGDYDYDGDCEHGSKGAKGEVSAKSSAKSEKTRRLVVPGTEDYVRRRRDGRVRALVEETEGSKSAKSSSGSKSNKTEGLAKSSKCHAHLSAKCSKKYGSKSEGAKSEKSGAKSNKDGGGSGDYEYDYDYDGKSAKSGAGKSAKSGASPAQAPTLCPSGAAGAAASFVPTQGSTPTVSTEITGPPTISNRADGPL